jgi:uncharacterized membrane protein (DUF106 family)
LQRRFRAETLPLQSVGKGLYDVDSLIYLWVRDFPEFVMKAFLLSVIVALGLGIAAYTVLEQNQMGASQKFSSGSTRL